jgi:predicted Zn-dependent protease
MNEIKLFLRDREVQIINEFTDENTEYCVYSFVDGWGDFKVTAKSNLQKEEDTYSYKRNKHLEELDRKIDEKTREIQDKAIKTLASRIKLNSAFQDTKTGYAGLLIAEELEKIIKNEEVKF